MSSIRQACLDTGAKLTTLGEIRAYKIISSFITMENTRYNIFERYSSVGQMVRRRLIAQSGPFDGHDSLANRAEACSASGTGAPHLSRCRPTTKVTKCHLQMRLGLHAFIGPRGGELLASQTFSMSISSHLANNLHLSQRILGCCFRVVSRILNLAASRPHGRSMVAG